MVDSFIQFNFQMETKMPKIKQVENTVVGYGINLTARMQEILTL